MADRRREGVKGDDPRRVGKTAIAGIAAIAVFLLALIYFVSGDVDVEDAPIPDTVTGTPDPDEPEGGPSD
ncbi:hypothetical protein BH23PSE1_BH23PSE1_18620 [soil metagenome]